jgi:hypothetical protein
MSRELAPGGKNADRQDARASGFGVSTAALALRQRAYHVKSDQNAVIVLSSFGGQDLAVTAFLCDDVIPP